jgi:hypothetical protein
MFTGSCSTPAMSYTLGIEVLQNFIALKTRPTAPTVSSSICSVLFRTPRSSRIDPHLSRLDFAECVLNGPTRSLNATPIDGAVVRVEREAVQCSVEFFGDRPHAGTGLAEPTGRAWVFRRERVLGGLGFSG